MIGFFSEALEAAKEETQPQFNTSVAPEAMKPQQAAAEPLGTATAQTTQPQQQPTSIHPQPQPTLAQQQPPLFGMDHLSSGYSSYMPNQPPAGVSGFGVSPMGSLPDYGLYGTDQQRLAMVSYCFA